MSDFIAQYEDNETKPSETKSQDKVKEKVEVAPPMDESDVIEAEKKAQTKTSTESPVEEAAEDKDGFLKKNGMEIPRSGEMRKSF